MDGLHESFELQGKSLEKKIEIRDNKIESLKVELLKMKDDIYDFKKNSTMDAYFKKHTDLVDRTGRRTKDYMQDLVKTVNDFLGDEDTFKASVAEVGRGISKDYEPSGVDSLLL